MPLPVIDVRLAGRFYEIPVTRLAIVERVLQRMPHVPRSRLVWVADTDFALLALTLFEERAEEVLGALTADECYPFFAQIIEELVAAGGGRGEEVH